MIGIALIAVGLVADAQFALLLACPRVAVPNSATGTGVVIGTKDGFAYLLTAAHVVGRYDQAEVVFTTKASYPKPIWYPDAPEVIARWPDADLALLRFAVGKGAVPVAPLAPAWQRPKAFPVPGQSAGVGIDPAATLRAESLQAKEFVTREGKRGAFFFRTVAAPEAGRSGGPLFDTKGRVIGIAVAASGGKGFYTHHDEILASLKTSGHGWLIPGP